MKSVIFALIFVSLFSILPDYTFSQSSKFRIARLKYSGGGDWYNDPSAEVNMMNYLKANTTLNVDEAKFYQVDIASDLIFDYPFILLTGHGNIIFSDSDVKRLKKYLENGGFI